MHDHFYTLTHWWTETCALIHHNLLIMQKCLTNLVLFLVKFYNKKTHYEPFYWLTCVNKKILLGFKSSNRLNKKKGVHFSNINQDLTVVYYSTSINNTFGVFSAWSFLTCVWAAHICVKESWRYRLPNPMIRPTVWLHNPATLAVKSRVKASLTSSGEASVVWGRGLGIWAM